ncbi:MAG TPA: V-type ATP synthase subunit A [Acholeplasma sp.]|nr:V-type ATP synthase subunit A [Acholeplasma sp.]
MEKGTITKVSGPLILAKGMASCQLYDVVKVSDKHLIGEIIELRDDIASIQVYEETAGIGPGEPVYFTNEPLSVELGPGLIEGIFDGIQRPLDIIYESYGANIPLGVEIPSLSRKKLWDFKALKQKGDEVKGGDVLGVVNETEVVEHKIMVPPHISGVIKEIKDHKGVNVDHVVCVIETKDGKHEQTLVQYWPVRTPRPYGRKLAPTEPMVTGQRVIDTLFPIASGGIAAIPGPFGSGKTVVQHQLAKWAEADIIVYVGCGERGNEMTDVLMEFPNLKDPKTGASLMKRTVLIANTSNMPVAAREASIYTGITIAEYFRDMGYKVAIMADSTSRWAEALREMSSRLEEMPGEEGYPAYLATRIASFYERAGLVQSIGNEKRVGSVTAIGAVSPPGGDTSEPVSQATLRIVKVFWGLSSSLAYARHFPAIDWLDSYSLYQPVLFDSFNKSVNPSWQSQVELTNRLLHDEAALQEIVRFVGMDSLGPRDRLKLRVSQMIREDYLHQNAFDEVDTYTSVEKQYLMLNLILSWYEQARKALDEGVRYSDLEKMEALHKISRAKYIEEDLIEEEFAQIKDDILVEFSKLIKED